MKMTPVPPFRSHIAGIGWPPVLAGPAATMAALLGQLDRSQWLDPATIRARQFRQLRTLAEHCATHSPHFARRLAEAGLTPAELATMRGLARLPLLRRRDVQSADDLFCVQIPPDHAPVSEVRSSGSTGEPVRVRRTAINQFLWSAHMMRDLLWHKRDLTTRQCAIRANLTQVERFDDWGGLVGALFETGEILAIPIATPITRLVEMIDRFQPERLVAYPNVVRGLIDECRARGRGFAGLRQLCTQGETLPQALREEAEAVWGVAVTDIYSSEETGFITLECPDAPLHHVMAETVIVELLRDDGTPCEEGELGRVVVTDLHNFVTPLIRYDLGDYAEAGPPCPCGRGLPTLRRVVGRERNLLCLPDGRRRWPLVGAHYFRDVAPVIQYQAIQHDYQRIELRLVVATALTSGQEADLRKMVIAALGHEFTVDINCFDDRIPTGPNGKFEEFICGIPMP